jgi:type II secretory pathway pseudopilin PulG
VEARVAGVWFSNRNGFTAIDAAITICLIGVLIGIVIPKYQRVAHEAQEVALKSALRNIRTSIKLFKALNERNPKGLNEMIEKEVILPARIGNDPYTGSLFKDKYLIEHAVDSKGNLLDAFGNPFIYDLRKGEVRTTTKGYETW